MKKCSTCQEEKPQTSFNKNKTKKDGLQTICRKCNKKRAKQYYHENRGKQLKTIYKAKKEKIKENKKRFYQFLLKSCCAHCGNSNPLVLECDHIFNKKENVSEMVTHYSWSAIEKEIEKCQVLCANCHRIKTHKENNSYRHRYYLGL